MMLQRCQVRRAVCMIVTAKGVLWPILLRDASRSHVLCMFAVSASDPPPDGADHPDGSPTVSKTSRKKKKVCDALILPAVIILCYVVWLSSTSIAAVSKGPEHRIGDAPNESLRGVHMFRVRIPLTKAVRCARARRRRSWRCPAWTLRSSGCPGQWRSPSAWDGMAWRSTTLQQVRVSFWACCECTGFFPVTLAD